MHIKIYRQCDSGIGSVMVNVMVLLIARWWESYELKEKLLYPQTGHFPAIKRW